MPCLILNVQHTKEVKKFDNLCMRPKIFLYCFKSICNKKGELYIVKTCQYPCRYTVGNTKIALHDS